MATPAEKMNRPERWRAPQHPSVPPLAPLPPSEPPHLVVPRRQRRVYLVSFLVSAALHVLAVILYPHLVARGGGPARPGIPVAAPQPQGTEIVVIREVPEAPAAGAETSPPPRAAPEPSPPSPPAAAPPTEVAPGAGAAAGAAPVPDVAPAAPAAPAVGAGSSGSPAERLRPGIPDLRLWTLDPKFTELTSEQILKLELLWTILDMNASAAEAAAAAKALSDWTYTDEEGKRWGVADGRIYLGDLVLPFPFAFGAPPGSDAANRAWIDAEIDRAAGSAAARANLNQRIKAIRERLDQERRRLRGDSIRVPPKP